jgi:peptide/nickel transport system permease protein
MTLAEQAQAINPGWSSRLRCALLNFTIRVAAILLVAAAAMVLVRYGPGFETDERELDPTLSAETRAALHNQRLAEGQLIHFTRNLLSGALHGDFGESKALGVPVRELIADRGPATLRILLIGSASAWIAGLAWAFALTLIRLPLLSGASTLASACLLCLPTAAIAALMLYANWPAEAVLAVALVPKILQVARGLVVEALDGNEVLGARARGLSSARILGWYVLPRIAAPIAAWLAATAGLAIGAIVPIEVICDVPGLGQLAWKAALARDLPVLVVLTLMVAILIQLSNGASALASGRLKGARA